MYKVLLADDEENILIGIKLGINWKKLNCEIIGTASDGGEAIDIIKRNPPDIILSDISMEPQDGLAICKYVVDNKLPVKCLLMTGYHDFDKAYKAINYGVSRLLLKPTAASDVESAVKDVISDIEKKQEALSVYEKLDMHSRENILLKRSILFRNIISGNMRDEDTESALSELGIELDGFFAVTIRMDGLRTSKEEDDRFMERYIGSVFSGTDKYVIHYSPDVEHIIFPVKEPHISDLNGIYDKCRRLSSIVDAIADYYITIGISAFHNDIRQIRRAVEEANEASRYISYDSEYPIVDYSSMPEISHAAMKKVRGFLQRINESIQKLEFAKASLYVRTLFEDPVFNEVSFNDLINIAGFILNVCVQQQLFYGGENFSIRDNAVSRISLKQSRNREDILNSIQTMFRELSEQIKYRDASCDLISKVKDYIRVNYASELSLESIGKVFAVSSGYLGKLFKQSENMNLSNYIQNVRIEKAKDLILHSDYHTYEIGEKVGITDSAYFSKLFKKITGCRVRDFKLAAAEKP